jgi:hypothetical protein
MDQPTPDPAPTPDHAAEADREDRVAHRLQARIETTEPLIAWTRGWVSREMRMHGVFAARTLDFGVLTDRWLYLLNTGVFTRRPRRCVYGARLAEIFVSEEDGARGKRLRITSPKGRPLWFEVRANEQTQTFATALLARTRHAPQTRAADDVGPDVPAPAPEST